MQPEIRTLPPMRTLYVERRAVDSSFQPSAGEAFAAALAYLDRHDLWSRVGPGIGYMPDDMMNTPAADWRYQAHYYIHDGDPIPADPEVHEALLDIGKVAVFPHLGAYAALPAAWGRVFAELLPASGLTLRHAPALEIYVSDPNHTPEAELLTEICIPVE